MRINCHKDYLAFFYSSEPPKNDSFLSESEILKCLLFLNQERENELDYGNERSGSDFTIFFFIISSHLFPMIKY